MNIRSIPQALFRTPSGETGGFPVKTAPPPRLAGASAAPKAAARGRERIVYLDAARGIGILLVVAGHCIGGTRAAGLVSASSAASFCFYLIYSFHMPLFFFLAGIFVAPRVTTRPAHFLEGSLTHIAYPYFIWGAVQTVFHILAAGVVNTPDNLPASYQFISMFWSPPAQFWFLYVLFFMHLIALSSIRAGGRAGFALMFALLFAVCTAFHGAAGFITHYVSGTNILFYVLGVCAGPALVNWRERIDRSYFLALIGAIVLLSLVWAGWTAGLRLDSYATLPAAFVGTAIVVLLCRTEALRENRWLAHLGRHSLTIYMLHVMCVAGARIALAKELRVENLAVIFPIIFGLGVGVPLAVYAAARALRVDGLLGLS